MDSASSCTGVCAAAVIPDSRASHNQPVIQWLTALAGGLQRSSIGRVHSHIGAKAAICTQAHSTSADDQFLVASNLVFYKKAPIWVW